MLNKYFALSVLMLLISSCLFAQSTLIRQPKISPDASQVAFSCYGDIFTYNFKNKHTKRLTIHKAYESNPVWKPNSKELAFSSNRKGNNNIFTTNLAGNIPKQLTFYPVDNIPTNWNEKGTILFSTKRVYAGPEWDAQIYGVNEKGGTPKRLIAAYGSMASMSPNGKFIAFVKGACRVAREDYSGAAQRDVWLYNIQTKEYKKITTSNKNEHSPLWDADNNLYYIGAEEGRYNIYKQKISIDGATLEKPIQLTNQKENGVREFSVSNSGVIIYTAGITVYKLDKGQIEKLDLHVSSDIRTSLEEVNILTENIEEYTISPSGKKIAFEAAGEIFVKLNNQEKRKSNNISKHSFKDKIPAFIDDETVLFLSDRSGQFEIYKAISTDTRVGLERSLKVQVTKLTNSEEDIEDLIIAPNRKKIAYIVGRGKLIIADIIAGEIKNKQIFIDSWEAPRGLTWSPDSKWIAYSQRDLNFDDEIFIQSITDKNKKMNVSMHPRSDKDPVWSADGKKLAFLSNRNGMNYDVWMVWLTKNDWEKSKLDYEEGYYHTSSNEVVEPNENGVTVEVDAHTIYDRLVQVTTLYDNEENAIFSPDSEFIYYSAINPVTQKTKLYKVKWDGTKAKEIEATDEAINLFQAKDKIYFTALGIIKELNTKLDKVTALPHLATYLKSPQKEREQMFEEGIRALTMGFYDPNFHGYNWKAIVDKYRPWVLSATTHHDYQYMYNTLLGQLNASHMGYRAALLEKGKSEKVGLLGLEVTNTKAGVKVNYILPNSVADKSKHKLNIGDVITAVNGKPILKNTNFYSLLKHTQNNETLLTLQSGKEVVLRPQSSLSLLRYKQWVNSRKELVKKYSNGQLGYIHIQGMNITSFEHFERELKASGYGKKGIVIDVRYNGGGWTTDRLMAVLNVKQHAYTIPRGATKNLQEHKKFSNYYPFNERAILSVNTKPMVALCNENSYSNAEIFSHAFKNLQLGKLVGQPTFGAVISTGGRKLTNGYIRMPFRAWFVKETGLNMENESPAMPDYLVNNKPGWKDRGEDEQLKKAVLVLLQDLK